MASRYFERRTAALLAGVVLAAAGWLTPMIADADGNGPAGSPAEPVDRPIQSDVQEGLVSWYGRDFHDRQTASGERFDSGAYTMAHPSLPFGTRVKVTNLRNGRSVVVRVNDRGPHVGRRIADLSQAAASQIGMMRRGIVKARIEVLTAADNPRD